MAQPKLSLFDTHCHLQFPHFDDDRLAVLERAGKAGVTDILIPSTQVETARSALALAAQCAPSENPGMPTPAVQPLLPTLHVAVGLHPTEPVPAVLPLKELRALAHEPQVCAIGEAGLDLHWTRETLPEQIRQLEAMLTLASETALPIILHSRAAGPELWDVVKAWRPSEPTRAGILHCFQEDLRTAERFLERGFYISYAGTCTYPKAQAVRETCAAIPLERLLLETDAPYLAPQAYRGKRNEPAYIAETAASVARVRSMASEDLARIASDNARRLLGIPRGV